MKNRNTMFTTILFACFGFLSGAQAVVPAPDGGYPGGNTAEVLDRVAEVIRGRMELRRLVDVLTAQARISRWILTLLPVFVLFMLVLTGGDYLEPMTSTLVGKIALVFGAVLVLIGSLWIKKISELDV